MLPWLEERGSPSSAAADGSTGERRVRIDGDGELLEARQAVVPALSANVTSTVGLVPGAVGGAIGYRAEVRHQRRRICLVFCRPMLVPVARPSGQHCC